MSASAAYSCPADSIPLFILNYISNLKNNEELTFYLSHYPYFLHLPVRTVDNFRAATKDQRKSVRGKIM